MEEQMAHSGPMHSLEDSNAVSLQHVIADPCKVPAIRFPCVLLPQHVSNIGKGLVTGAIAAHGVVGEAVNSRPGREHYLQLKPEA